MRILFNLSIVLVIMLYNIAFASSNYSERDVFTLLKKQNFDKAITISKQMNNSALTKIALSQKYLNCSSRTVSFKEIINFLNKNPAWPQASAMQAKAEYAINSNTDQLHIFEWFSRNQPVTGAGHKFYALAANKYEKNEEKKTNIIKNGWINGDFSASEQKDYIAKFSKFLSQEDHVAKIDNQLMKKQIKIAKESLHLVNKGYKQNFNTQIALITRNKKALKLFKNIPTQNYTYGLIYYYLDLQKLENISKSEITNLFSNVKGKKYFGNKIAKLQLFLAREHIQNKKFHDAYSIISMHFADSASEVSDAEFLSGWIALRFLNKPKLAIKHFEKFNKIVKTPISLARGNYWLARSYMRDGKKDLASELYDYTSDSYPYTFYGQLSAVELGHNNLHVKSHHKLSEASGNKNILRQDLYKATILIAKHSKWKVLTQIYLDAAAKAAPDNITIVTMMNELEKTENNHYKVWFAKAAMQRGVFVREHNYPCPYKTDSLPVEKELTYSIIRQESVFDQHAVSSASAIGLMQLVEPTACKMAISAGLKCDIKKLTQDPHHNIALGSKYLAYLIDNYNGSYLLSVAAYNAGPGNVKKWVQNFGDPRKMKDLHMIIDWIELIPFYETRNYVQRVLESIKVYNLVLNKNESLRIKADLLRGEAL